MFINFDQDRTVNIGQRQLGDGCQCFITLEAGATHDSLKSAINLADCAMRGGQTP